MATAILASLILISCTSVSPVTKDSTPVAKDSTPVARENPIWRPPHDYRHLAQPCSHRPHLCDPRC